MTLTELRYLVALAHERHFGRAAELCFVTQPTLSVAIKKLEDELGIALFERRPTEVVPTAIGEQIAAQATRILDEVKAIKTVAQVGKDPLGSLLRLGAIYTVGPYLLPSLVPEIRRRAPNMPLVIEEQFTNVLAERLKLGQLDAIIVSEPFSEAGIVAAPVYDEPFLVAMPSGHPWERRASVPPEILSDETALLLSAGNCFRDQVLKSCPGLNRAGTGEIQKTLEGSSLATIRYMVAAGVGITVLPCTGTGDGNVSLGVTLRPFAEPVPRRRIILAWRAQFPRPEAIMLVKDAIRRCPLECVEWLS